MKPLENRRPAFTAADAVRITADLYNIESTAQELPSGLDRNFHITAESGEQYVLKIAYGGAPLAEVEMQNAVLTHLASKKLPIVSPEICVTRRGELTASVNDGTGAAHHIRLLSFLDGRPLAKVKPHTHSLIRRIGRSLAQMDAGLGDFSCHAAERNLPWDLKNAPATIAAHKAYVQDASQLEIVEHCEEAFANHVLPHLPSLRQSLIHNDANDHNLILSGETADEAKIGVIDFGDLVKTCTVFEPAIAAAYVVLGKKDPVKYAASLIAGYHTVMPLSELEIELLFLLIFARLCVSVCISAYQQQQEPENEYLRITERPAWETLQRLRSVHPRFATCAFRQACGFSPSAHSARVTDWLRQRQHDFHGIVELDLRNAPSLVFDLTVASPDLTDLSQLTDVGRFSKLLLDKLAAAGAAIGIGRYNEPRLCYTSDQFHCESDEMPEARTIHLGIDLFLEAGTAVYTPLDAKVHGFQHNAQPLDYGPTIILEHQADEGISFFTLYGHLTRDSLEGLAIGKIIHKGELFCKIGDYPENGNWPPHLHFQLITDIFDQVGNFDGVALNSQRELWLSICPDPNLILGIPSHHFPQEAPEAVEILERREKTLGKSLSLSYDKPLHIVRGYRQYLFDASGQRYLDGVNNIAHVGHSHPHVVEALHAQAAVLNTNTRYLHKNIVEYSDALCSTLPEHLNVCYFVCSGSEANELALRLARTHTARYDIAVVDGAYHGNTNDLVEISPYKFSAPGGRGRPRHVHVVEMPDVYRGRYRSDDRDAGRKYADLLSAKLEKMQSGGREIAAFICEPLLGCGGQIVPPPGFMKKAFEAARAAGGVCIADEIQVGFGRVGSQFWGFQTQDAVPDIVTLGKPMGNGHPVAAVVTTREIAESFDNGMEYFNSFGGNPVSCAVGLAVLQVIQEERLQENAHEVGNYLQQALGKLKKDHRLIGDVRGLGLFIGIELVLNQETLEPAPLQARYIVERMRDHGILLSSDGPLRNVIKIKPPLVFDRDDADYLVGSLAKILHENFVQTL